MKQGLVLLPFLQNEQLKGFIEQECAEGVITEDVYTMWEQKQQYIKSDSNLNKPVFEEMNSDDVGKYFQEQKFDEYYKDRNVLLGWVKNVGGLIPTKPFVSLDACEACLQEYKKHDLYQICLNPSINKVQAKANFKTEGEGLTFSLLANERSIHIKEVNAEKGRDSGDLTLTVKVGRPSPYIEIVQDKGQLYLVNGLHRIYVLLRENNEEKIPCVLIQQDERQYTEMLPYQGSLRLPIMNDFLQEDLTQEFNLQTGYKHIQIISREDFFPAF